MDLDAAPPSSSVTEAAAHARRTFDASQWSDAAIELQKVASGDTGDAKPTRQLAQYDLAVALFHLELFQASFGVFSEIASDPSHPELEATLPWLARLAEVLPEPANVVERIGKYDKKALARFDNDAERPLYSELNYLLGRYDYSARNYEDAIACFDHVSKESPSYVEAKFFSGISSVALRRSAPAVQAFLDVEDALDSGNAHVDDPARMRDLAYLSLARTYYSASIHLDGSGVPTLDATRLSAAVKYWNKIDLSSEYWLDAQFEESWAYFMAGDSARTMGNVHTIESPYFASGLYPEADILKAVVYYKNCQYEEATTVAAGTKLTYAPIRKKLEELYERLSDDDADARFFDLARDVRADKASLDPEVLPMVKHALGDRELLRSVEYVKVLDREHDRLGKMTPAFRAAPVGSDVSDAIDLAKAVAIKKAGTLAKDRLRRSIADLDEQLRNAQKVLIDVTDAERENLETVMRTIGGPPHTEPPAESGVEIDDEHEMWPFDGEYWRDELGTYRQHIVSKCR